MVYSTGLLIQNSVDDNTTSTVPVLDAVTTGPIFNLVQVVYAAARVDFGIESPNNLFLHKDAINMSINKTFPATPSIPAQESHLYSALQNPTDPVVGYTWLADVLPLNLTGIANIQVVYLCQFQRRKSPGSLVVSVLVATMSMFSTGWGIYFLMITVIAKRRANCLSLFSLSLSHPNVPNQILLSSKCL